MLVMMAMLPMNMKAQVSVWDGTYSPWTNGTGTEADPFLIENAQQLAYLAYRVNNGLDAAGGHVSNHDLYYKLMTDVDLNGREDFQWTPIGYWISNTNYYSFGGHFDGNNHTISGLYINSSANRVGFFGYTDGATILNLSVSGDTVATTGQYAGGIVGYSSSLTITNCNNVGNISSALSCGGIVGYNYYGALTITNCYNVGNISSSTSSCGGIVGYNYYGALTITNCNNVGNISSAASSCGGIVGYNYYMYSSSLTITNCYNVGNISSAASCGGIMGNSYHNGALTITNCYNVGNISSSYSGGIVGNGTAHVTNCFYLDTCAANNTYGGLPMTAEVMRTPEFVEMLNNGSCAWEQDVAPQVNNGYPILTMMIQDAYTEPATDLTAVSATLNGYVTVEHATIISKGFEYRELGDSTFTAINVTGNSNDFSFLLNGLTPNTTYEYRTFVNVVECPYTAYGNIETFEVSWLNADTIYIYDADMLQWVSDRCNSGTDFAASTSNS